MRKGCIYGLCLALVLLVGSAQAYIGPGPGLGMLDALVTFFGSILFSLMMILFYPVRLLLKLLRRRKEEKGHSDSAPQDDH
jgi:hypothetical protein